jgi:hypothetical protein
MLRKSFAFFVVGCVVLALSASASAGIVASATLIKDPSAALPFAAPDAALGSPWVSYKLVLTATGADTIQAVDATISGQLHQRWSASGSDGVYDTATGNSTNATNGDSHFLATNTMLFASGPTEDNPATFTPLGGGSPLSPTNTVDTGYGVGTSMSAVFGPPGAALTSLNLAYIVVQKTALPNLNIHVNALNPNGDIIATLTAADFGFGGAPPAIPVVTPLDIINPAATGLNATVGGTVTATNTPTSWTPALNSLVLASYTPNYGAAGAVGFVSPPLWDPATQAFSWNTTGSKRGDYVWNVSATNASGTGNGTITVHQQAVPEPATLTLFGLAAIGLVGVARRRS